MQKQKLKESFILFYNIFKDAMGYSFIYISIVQSNHRRALKTTHAVERYLFWHTKRFLVKTAVIACSFYLLCMCSRLYSKLCIVFYMLGNVFVAQLFAICLWLIQHWYGFAQTYVSCASRFISRSVQPNVNQVRRWLLAGLNKMLSNSRLRFNLVQAVL